jgi:spore coat protein U-like protein
MRLRLCFLAIVIFFPQTARAICVPALSVSATGVNFGVYDPGAASSTKSMGTVAVQCTIGILPSFQVALSTGGSGSYATRKMSNGTDRLSYNLYTDAGRTIIWGDGSGGTSINSFGGLISLGSTSFTVYGKAPKGQYPAPGSFTDTITVTVTY